MRTMKKMKVRSQVTAAQDEGEQDVHGVDNPLNDSLAVPELQSSPQDELSVLIVYDCEATGGNINIVII